MNTRCVDAAFYWTPKEAGAIVDYLDRLRDTVWELYSEDIIGYRTKELDGQVDPRQRDLCFDDETYQTEQAGIQAPTPYYNSDSVSMKLGDVDENKPPREALPPLDELPSLSDENIADMLSLLRALLHACEEHYKDPIRRFDELRAQELTHPGRHRARTPSTTDWNDDDF